MLNVSSSDASWLRTQPEAAPDDPQRNKKAPPQRRGTTPNGASTDSARNLPAPSPYEQALPCDGWKPFAFASASDM